MPEPKLMWLGTYERNYSRTRVLISGLEQLGAGVVQHHRPLWELTRHKAGGFLSPRHLPLTAARYGAAWARLVASQRRAGPVDAVVAGYPAQPDVPLSSLVARRRGVPLVVDAMISLADTLAGDRARLTGRAGSAVERLDRLAVRRADLLMVDTAEHAAYFAARFGASRERTAVVPVGAEPELFAPSPASAAGDHVLFYGKLAPLHGVETVLGAARMPGVAPVRLIGEGQLDDWLAGELVRDRPRGLVHQRWVPYERLGQEIADCAICLGIFGTSEKAARVVPNKVFQAMSVGRPIVTADTPAVREVLSDGDSALLVPAGDPEALAAALCLLAGDAELRARLADGARRRFEEIGTPAAVARRLLDGLASLPEGRR